jgi:hypothetical protein
MDKNNLMPSVNYKKAQEQEHNNLENQTKEKER